MAYATMGLAVLPLRPRGKTPLSQHGVRDASTDHETVSRWWRRWPDANIGIAIPPGYLILDIDSDDALQRLKHEGLAVPTTASATTGRGLHLWYRALGYRPRNAVALLPKIDVRASGGYVVAPPSVHPLGERYRWLVELVQNNIADAPSWILERLHPTGATWQGRSASAWFEVVSNPVPEGRRNQSLAALAGLLFRRLPAQVAAELAFCWAQARTSPPLSDREIQRTLDSIASRELRRREEQQ